MTDDTAAAMDHLRQSCAIAAGKAKPPVPPRPRPVMEDMFTGEARQVTCWETGGYVHCGNCGNHHPVFTDGRLEWASCIDCGVTRTID